MDNKKHSYKLPGTLTRREFITKTGLFTGGVIAILSGTTALGFYGATKKKLNNKVVDEQTTWIELGSTEQFQQLEDVMQVDFSTEIQDAWVTRKVNGTVYVTKDKYGELLVLSPICTHLGCNVAFGTDSDKKKNPELEFYCPCHGGQYNRLGINIGGPPPRPLDIYKPVVQDGKVYINYYGQIQRK